MNYFKMSFQYSLLVQKDIHLSSLAKSILTSHSKCTFKVVTKEKGSQQPESVRTHNDDDISRACYYASKIQQTDKLLKV